MSRLFQYRAAFMLVASSASVFWLVSFWLPLPSYLEVLNSPNYADYQTQLKLVVFVNILFCLLNLITAGLFFTKISSSVKAWLALIPAILIFIAPLVAAATILNKVPGKNYFELIYGFSQLLRFSTGQIFGMAVAFTLFSVAANCFIAFRVRKSTGELKLPPKLRNRYLIYSGVFFACISLWVLNVSITSVYRTQDRASCYGYGLLQVPQLDADIAPFLNQVQLEGQTAGNLDVKIALLNVATISRQYFNLLSSNASDSDLEPYKNALADAKSRVIIVCAPFVTE